MHAKSLAFALGAIFVLASNPAWAQYRGHRLNNNRNDEDQPCWVQAGISKAANQQRAQIERDARAQVQAVCVNPSLSTEQKQGQIRQIWQTEAKLKSAVLTPLQEQTLVICREQRGEQTKPKLSGAGPCGEFPAPPPASADTKPAPPGAPATPATVPPPAQQTPPSPPADTPAKE